MDWSYFYCRRFSIASRPRPNGKGSSRSVQTHLKSASTDLKFPSAPLIAFRRWHTSPVVLSRPYLLCDEKESFIALVSLLMDYLALFDWVRLIL